MTLSSSYVRFALESGHTLFVTACPLSAKSRLMHRSKKHLYLITSLARLHSARPKTVRSPDGRRARSCSGTDGSASFVGDTLGRHQGPCRSP